MLLTITTTHRPATDLGYLLHKHPARCQAFDLSFGQVHVFYPEAGEETCTAALLLDVDPVGLVRKPGQADFALAHYVNDRPYVASSFMSAAIAQIYGTALNGHCQQRPELAQTPIPLQAGLVALPCQGGEGLLRRLFEPLGYAVQAERQSLDPHFPEWGESRIYNVTLEATVRLADLLTHLYVLIPVLDDEKHYYVGEDEIDKLLNRGAGWLAAHPEQKLIAHRYLKHRWSLTRQALARLADDAPDPAAAEAQQDQEEEAVERPLSLNTQRLEAVAAALKDSGALRVLDLGCGEGNLLKRLMAERQFVAITGVDISQWTLQRAAQRLKLDRLPPAQRERIQLLQSALTYRDERLAGYDAAALVEVVEHVDPPRLAALERTVFEFARPGVVVVTTPNAEYNARFATLPAGRFRHRDHRFEWTRAEFQEWAGRVARRFGYTVHFQPIGPVDDELGSPTQMAVFRRPEMAGTFDNLPEVGDYAGRPGESLEPPGG
ncbi:MAG: 3' terminal RNA ribose 2'-O-methyltransferase Hen1 [Chloroflexi bacterium]|nr:3' terminal RNA ribose 2'-O-methyltransferase Hen1 [Chloroflexota bacterium]MCI0575169.1 3' terminal RNA ribose 2'-O-methyltransferase Hen1 [Chloroflexota bacterium]MCI0647149.1 3' terminal RNA ribose 2'-O-methyltransferase Hen1 [Chloroflexota bacterium]MCI0729975.1 3' terminal RNA ribose 2'-O-methyltransferase Hen1 [Chloroflexota bacterium]